ncbi:LysR family transcriptional regulator, partial [Rhizobiaceae sp. 2RAB30]
MVAQEGSFTRAAAKLGMSQSALSHAMKQLEQRIGVRLLTRTTRSVATTEPGERLLRSLQPALQQISSDIASIRAMKGKPSGTIRIASGRYPAASRILPVLEHFTAEHPEIDVELVVDERFTDIVSERFDAGIRLGEHVEKDMISVPISPEIRSIVVGAPDYFETNGRPLSPRDLTHHDCITYRQMSAGGVYPWEFEKEGRK